MKKCCKCECHDKAPMTLSDAIFKIIKKYKNPDIKKIEKKLKSVIKYTANRSEIRNELKELIGNNIIDAYIQHEINGGKSIFYCLYGEVTLHFKR